jgi:hypothetical protein
MIELHITWDETTGSINVHGPIHNKGLCYMMLESAKDAIREYCEAQKAGPADGLKPFIQKRTPKPKR